MKSLIHNQKLAKYSGVAAALLSQTDLSSQILYTNVNPDLVLTGPSTAAPFAFAHFDLNQDGQMDFTVLNMKMDYGSYGQIIGVGVGYYNNYSAGLSSPSNAIVGNAVATSYGSYSSNVAAKLNNGVNINAQQDFIGYGYMAINNFGTPNPIMEWSGGVTEKFVGLKLRLNNNDHYGWARFSVSSTFDTVILHDMAVNLTPNQGIQTGQTMRTINELKEKSSVQMHGSVLEIKTDVDFSDFLLTIKNMNGQLLQQEDLKAGQTHRLNLEHLPEGYYLVSIHNRQLIISQKLLLNH